MIIRKVEPKRYLELKIAAILIDYGVYFTLISIYIIIFGTPSGEDGYTLNGTPMLLPIVLWVLYFVVLEVVNQATPGHDILKLGRI